jgi:hypothetical protein
MSRYSLSATRRSILWGALLATTGFTASAYQEGAPPAHTGGFEEPSCQRCHADGPLNDSLGRIVVEGLPERYASGKRYRITVTLSRPEMRLGGFQLSARFAGGERAGRQAGTLRATDDRARLSDTAGVQYAGHTAAGSALTGRDSARWVIEWTAPAAPAGAVVFHTAANAANDDDSELGDNIYTRSVTSRP